MLAALWSRLPPKELPEGPEAWQQLLLEAPGLAPLAGSPVVRESWQALFAAFAAVAGMVSEMADPAWLLTRLSAVSITKVSEHTLSRPSLLVCVCSLRGHKDICDSC